MFNKPENPSNHETFINPGLWKRVGLLLTMLAGMTACRGRDSLVVGTLRIVNDGHTLRLREDPLDPYSDSCSLGEGEKVTVLDKGFVSGGGIEVEVVQVGNQGCEGWNSDQIVQDATSFNDMSLSLQQ